MLHYKEILQREPFALEGLFHFLGRVQIMLQEEMTNRFTNHELVRNKYQDVCSRRECGSSLREFALGIRTLTEM